MTVMPFMLIIQLVFSGFIVLPEKLADVSRLMLSKWGVQSLCVSFRYNDLPAMVIWNKMLSSGNNIDIGGGVSVRDVMDVLTEQNMRELILDKLRIANQRPDFATIPHNLIESWIYLLWFVVLFAIVTIIFLEFVDRDNR